MKSKGLALFATMMAALMLVGTGFALWSEILVIQGTVYTGDVDVELIAGLCWDDEEKDVSSIFCEVINGVLVVTVTNAYPCIHYYQEFGVHCLGSVPVDLAGIYYTDDLPGTCTAEITGFALGDQLHECQTQYGVIHIHLTNDAREGATYTFYMEMDWWQYNEYP